MLAIDDIQSDICFGRNTIGTCNKEEINLFNNKFAISKKEIINSNSNSIKYSSNGEFTLIFNKDAKLLYLVRNDDIILKKSIDVDPKIIYTNENGYIAILYSQVGYKTGIKIFKPNGDEVITTYLANSYATSIDVSHDNKFAYIGEVDGGGIKIQSKIKAINLDNQDSKEIELPLGCIITDISSLNDRLIIKTDDGLYEISTNDNSVKKIINYEEENVLSTFVDNQHNIVLLKNNGQNTSFDQSGDVLISFYNKEDSQDIIIPSMPQIIDVYNDVVAIGLGNEVWIAKNGYLKSKIRIEEAINGINIFSNGNELALFFRNKIKIYKI